MAAWSRAKPSLAQPAAASPLVSSASSMASRDWCSGRVSAAMSLPAWRTSQRPSPGASALQKASSAAKSCSITALTPVAAQASKAARRLSSRARRRRWKWRVRSMATGMALPARRLAPARRAVTSAEGLASKNQSTSSCVISAAGSTG